MKNLNNIKTKYTFKISAVLAFGLMFMPISTTHAAYGSNVTDYYSPVYVETVNPKPVINSISPSGSNRGIGTKTVTITGSNFIPGSIAKVNGSNRYTTFIDYSHLLIQLNSSDMSRTEGFYIGVFNGAPGGGFSNAVYFTINNTNVSTNTETVNYSNDTFTETNGTSTPVAEKELSNLTSNAIFGSNSFLPSGLAQWIILAIIILLIVIFARKVFGGEKNYHGTPLKHE
ncbi:MAG: IPT/TIG domain-containing protein [bacterium]